MSKKLLRQLPKQWQITFFSIFLASSCFAQFMKLPVPEAKCGDGSQYSIFLEEAASSKLLFVFQGGGACWNKKTCFGFPAYTRKKLTGPYKEGVLSQAEENPFRDWTKVFFPYCTGDVFLGDHLGSYGGKTFEHRGRSNMLKVFETLKHQGFHIEVFNEVTVYGASAGALGAIGNMDLIDHEVPLNIKKTLIVDSPGLHFSDSVWERFTPLYKEQFLEGLSRNDIRLEGDVGLIAPYLPDFCSRYFDWKIGFLQSAQDFVMSEIFGGLSKAEHAKLVYGESGMYETLENPTDSCASWNPNMSTHVFLEKAKTLLKKTSDSMSAWAFMEETLSEDDLFESHR